MPINSIDFLNSAKQLINGNTEMNLRNATSRAYYAAYHEAKRISKYSNFKVSNNKAGIHQRMIEKLIKHQGSSSKDTDIRQIGIILSQCKKGRTKADYSIHAGYSRIEADTIVLQVENLIQISTRLP
ncbi:hypothetical protein PGH45_09125 [Legionella pneumophila]|nr:hypothetical protein [Legionella pneumophila]